mgnify:CR=1 FL=1
MFFSLSDSKLSKIAKYSAFFTSLIAIIMISLILSTQKAFDIARKPAVIVVDVTNKLNICTPANHEG